MTLKEALDSGYCSLEDDIDFDDTPQGEKIACLKLEIERLHNIIKEVREYIENTTYADITGLETHSIKEFWFVKELLEILDKEKE